MSVMLKPDHLKKAEEFVRNTKSGPDGLAKVDLEKFWHDQQIAKADPFGKDIPQVPLGAICNHECVFDELGVPLDNWRYDHDQAWRLSLNKAYNDKAEKIVGKRLLNEKPAVKPAHPVPRPRELYEIFEMENVWDKGSQSWWLNQAANTPEELKALLDRVEKRLENLRGFMLPEGWDKAKKEVAAAGGRMPRYTGQRGPVTFAMSLYGVENLVYLIMDDPDLAGRFRDLILKAMMDRINILEEEAGFSPANPPKTFGFADDNCAMLNAEMYEFFAYPIVKSVWERCAPGRKDSRFQHSDSDMAHIVPILARCGLTGVNFGPNVMADYIRGHMPEAVIHGVLAPFTYSRNEEVNMVAEFLRDFELTREKRGLLFSTAGSVNNGSRLSGMRLLMSAIQHLGRY